MRNISALFIFHEEKDYKLTLHDYEDSDSPLKQSPMAKKKKYII